MQYNEPLDKSKKVQRSASIAQKAQLQYQESAAMQLQRKVGNQSVLNMSNMLQRQTDSNQPGSYTLSLPFTSYTLDAFATDSAELTSAHMEILKKTADDLNSNPLVTGGFVTVTGEADKRGTDEHNKVLGQKRADAVASKLKELVKDETTKGQIRAYSLGEPAVGPEGDVPELRKVTITIDRTKSKLPSLGTPQLTPPSLPNPAEKKKVPYGSGSILDQYTPDILKPRIPIPFPSEDKTKLPPWFWKQLPPAPKKKEILNQISDFLTEKLGRKDIARLGAAIASKFGADQAEVEKSLNDAMVSGGEEGIKQLLKKMIEGLAGNPVEPQQSPYGPATQEKPTPPIINSPSIPF